MHLQTAMTFPLDRNIALKEIEKKSKYKDLQLEIQRIWWLLVRLVQ